VTDEVEYLHAEAVILDRSEDSTRSEIVDWCQRAHDCLAYVAHQEPTEVSQWRHLLLPYFMKSDFLRRCREQPQGYAGDFRIIQMMYDARPGGVDVFGKAVDEWAMRQPYTRAVRNRRQLVRDILTRMRNEVGPDMHVVSLGCGPAAEVFDVADLTDVRFTLVDIDADAVAFVKEKVHAWRMESRVTAIRKNVIKMVLDDEVRFVYPPSVIYSLGVIDYFTDELVVHMLDYMHATLAPGGVAFLGNVTPDHPNVALFEHALNWPLVLRSKEELLRLVRRSKFAGCPVAIGAEEENAQLFVECRKPF